VLIALALFLGPPAATFIIASILTLRGEIREMREVRRRDQAEAEAMAAEGYPPPGPPTTVKPTP